MKNCCCTFDTDICSQIECVVKETEKGIQVDIKPKDPAKTESLKALVKACKDFCNCGCC